MSKICHIITQDYPIYSPRIYFKECLTLKSDYSVVILAANATSAIVDGISIFGFEYPSKPTLLQFLRLYKLVFKEKAAIYHIHEAKLLPLALMLTWLGKQVIIDINEHYFNTMHSASLGGLRKKIYRYAERKVRTNGAVILSQRAYIPSYQRNTKKICVIEDFCDLSLIQKFRLSDRSQCTKLIYIGETSTLKTLTFMHELLHDLRHSGLDISLDIVGEIPDKRSMEELDSESYFFGLRNHVHWHGNLGFKEALELTRHSFAALYLKDIPAEETDIYPSVIFEYMGLGLPVVATATSLLKAVIERRECGICVDPANRKAIVTVITDLFVNKELQKHYSLNGPKAVELNYNWAHEKNILLDFYRKV